MADDLQSGICSGSWWNSSRSTFSDSSPCSSGLNDIGNFGWPLEITDVKGRPCEGSETTHSTSITGSMPVFPDKGQPPDSGAIFMDSSLQMAGFGLSTDWSQALLRSGERTESSLSVLQEDLTSRSDFSQEPSMESTQFQKDWTSKSFSGGEDSARQINQALALEQRLNSGNISGNCTVTGRSTPINSNYSTGSASYPSPSTLLPGLFDQESQQQQQQQYYGNRVLTFPSVNYRMNLSAASEDFPASWSKFPQFINKSTPQANNQLHFSNNGRFWNASTAMNDIRSSLFGASSHPQFLTQSFEEKPNLSNLTAKINTEVIRDSSSETKKSSNEPALKRPRLETPSPLPTFKVRKEKLGDRITALQQMVAPFGKTDTASVLWEAIEYIKFLHEQVRVLTNPYMKNEASMQHQQSSDQSKDAEGLKQDLRSRGLCLVPVSSTYPVTIETSADIWTPTFGGTYR